MNMHTYPLFNRKAVRVLLLFMLVAVFSLSGKTRAASLDDDLVVSRTSEINDRFMAVVANHPVSKKNQGKILLAGSSTMSRWGKRRENPLSAYGAMNMAVPGSRSDDWLRWYRKAIVRYKPSVVVLYVGVNDGITSQSQARRTAGNITKLLGYLRKELPKARICYVSVVATPRQEARYKNSVKYTASANSLIQNYCRKQKRIDFYSISGRFLKNGKVRKALFGQDRIHPNEKGLKIWDRTVGRKVVSLAKKPGLKKEG